MPTFSISAPPGAPLTLSNGTGTLNFTVTNTSPSSATGSAVIVPSAPTTLDWYAVGGDNTRTFPAGGVQSFPVTITTPPGTPAGAYGFRLDAKSEANPEEDYTEGPAVQFMVPAPPKKVPWWKKYWWIIAIAAVVLIGIVIAIIVLSGGSSSDSTAGVPEFNCVKYNSGNLSINSLGDGSLEIAAPKAGRLALADNNADAQQVLKLAQSHAKHCQIGNGARGVEYWVGTGKGPAVTLADCIGYDPGNVSTRDLGAVGIQIISGNSALSVVPGQTEADQAVQVIKAFSKQCFVGRDNQRPNRLEFITEDWEK
jgi:hypothetical protein